ncbi:MAG: lipopolysaccharide transport periplasmic protein LptA [Candidatus Schekmanbacteria bacterium]|nr:MAG: lipopolysaccharide transport periplasmic protein LptA [Candidatus Schekmanbacteria bacterium]
MRRIIGILGVFLLLILLTAQKSEARNGLADILSKGGGKDIPINITSDRMEAYNKKDLIIFYGNVKATRGDTTLWADRMDIYLDKSNKKISKIVALGNVKVNQGDKNAVAEKGTYFDKTQEIVLEGNPLVWQKNNVLKGSSISLHLDQDRIVVNSAKVKIEPKTFNKKEKKGK